jgi:flagellar biosynthetic protein FlhB
MSEEQQKDQEKTEQPTQKRRDEARKKGQVAKSQEITSVAILLACLTLFYFTSTVMIEKVVAMTRWTFMESGRFVIDDSTIGHLIIAFVIKMFGVIGPLLLTVVVIAVLANIIQIGFISSSEAIMPKLSKISPLRGAQRLFSIRALVELAKNILKIVIVGIVAYLTIKGEVRDLVTLGNMSTWGVMTYMGNVTFKVIFRSCWILLVLAVLDYMFQKWEFEKNLRMSKQEIKDEFKQTEGDPLIKSRIKRIQREMARKRMMARVPEADVIITNPTHLAVALVYDQGSMDAPTVLAKGRGFIAEKIKEIGRKSGVPIIENKPLAQVLYKVVDVNGVIPTNLYTAVAEVLAYVYNIKPKRTSRSSTQ